MKSLSDGDRFVTIASLEDKHWRRLEFPYDIHTVNYYGITLHERLHYYVPDVKNVEDDNDENSDEDDGNKKGIWDRLSDSPRKLIYLDPITEKLHMFPMPEPKNNQQENIIVGLGVLNECLCMSRLDDDKSGVEILVMKEYGVKESWTSLFLIRNLKINSSYGDVVPFFVTKAGEVALITEYNHRKKVVVFNPKNDNMRDILIVKIGTEFIFGPTFTYVESLISPKEYYWSEEPRKMFEHRCFL